MKGLTDRLEHIQNWITFLLLWLLMVTVAIEVFVRYVIRQPLFLWSEELDRYALIWMAFLAIGIGVKNGAHFAMDLLVGALPQRGAALLRLFGDLCMAAIFGFLTVGGIRFARFGTTELSTAMQIPMVWIYASVPVGGILSLIYLVERISQHVRDLRGSCE